MIDDNIFDVTTKKSKEFYALYLSRKKHNFLISLINYRAILILLMIN